MVIDLDAIAEAEDTRLEHLRELETNRLTPLLPPVGQIPLETVNSNLAVQSPPERIPYSPTM